MSKPTTRVERGFIEHGHLYGQPALTVAPVGSDLSVITGRWTYPERLHFLASGQEEADSAARMVTLLGAASMPCISMSIPPGVTMRNNALACNTILVLSAERGMDFEVDDIDPRVASLSVHFWPGSGVLTTLERATEAHLGRFLVLSPDDIGDAKVWLAGSRNPNWKIVPAYPFNNLEAAELAEMMG